MTIELVPETIIYWDTNLFIYLVEGDASLVRQIETLLEMMERQRMHAVTSELALAECLYKPARDSDEALMADYDRLFESGEFVLVPMSPTIVRSAALEGGRLGLKLLDAIHFVSARHAGCHYFLSADRHFRSVEGMTVLHFDRLSLALRSL